MFILLFLVYLLVVLSMFEGEAGSISTRLQGGLPASLSLFLWLNESQCTFVPFVSLIMSVFDKGFKALRSLVAA